MLDGLCERVSLARLADTTINEYTVLVHVDAGRRDTVPERDALRAAVAERILVRHPSVSCNGVQLDRSAEFQRNCACENRETVLVVIHANSVARSALRVNALVAKLALTLCRAGALPLGTALRTARRRLAVLRDRNLGRAVNTHHGRCVLARPAVDRPAQLALSLYRMGSTAPWPWANPALALDACGALWVLADARLAFLNGHQATR